MTAAERQRLFIAARNRVLRELANISDQTLQQVLELLETARKQILATLAGSPTDFQQFQQRAALAQVDAAIERFRTGGSAVWVSGANQAWAQGLLMVSRPLAAGGVNIGAALLRINDRQLVAMRAFLIDRIDDISTKARAAIRTQLGLAITGAQSVAETTANIDQLLGGNARARATTITNTEINRAASLATFEGMLAAEQRVPGLRKQWRRSHKLHSRIEHDLIDGQIRPIKKPFQVGEETLRFPRDPDGSAKNTINCGCTLLPSMASWDVVTPGAVQFTTEEIARNPVRAELNALIGKRTPRGKRKPRATRPAPRGTR